MAPGNCTASRTRSNRRSNGSGPGTVGLPVVAGGVPVVTGDLVLGDADGVVVVPRARIAEIVTRLETIRAAEQGLEAAVRDGLTVPSDLVKLLASNQVRRLG